MNSLMRDHLTATYFEDYQALRNELVAILEDADLAFRPGASTFTLGELCREIGEIERSYIEALATSRQVFGGETADPLVEHSVAALTAWFADLDRRLLAAIERLTDDDVANRRITRTDVEGFSPLPTQELDIYREALLIFYAKVSIYLRAMGRDLPGHWGPWIG